jgi:O-antigen/teichoic acid export membrane protein
VSNTLLGYYAIVEKIVRAGGAILVALPRALYPYMAKLHQSSIALFYQRNLYLALGLLAIMIPVAGGVYYLAPEILSLVSGKEHPPAIMIKLLQMLSPLFAVVIFGNLFTNILVILNETKLMNKVVVTAGLLNLALVYPTIKYFSVEGLAWLNLFIAMCVIVMTKGYFIFYHFKKRDVPKHKPS